MRVLVVGLGNPGSEYSGTRHNIGWMVVEELARRARVTLKKDRSRSLLAEHDGVGLCIPQTYMNLSGGPVQGLRDRHRLEPAQIWVIHDDLDLPVGRLRIRKGGGAGGHNGIRSLIAGLGSQEFPRFRVGVGRPDRETVDYVLSRPRGEERERLLEAVSRAADAVEAAAAEGLDLAMNRFNPTEGTAGAPAPAAD